MADELAGTVNRVVSLGVWEAVGFAAGKFLFVGISRNLDASPS
jgi:cyclopropane fatty-acyl-phospholipid synthase-like methyltransferase